MAEHRSATAASRTLHRFLFIAALVFLACAPLRTIKAQVVPFTPPVAAGEPGSELTIYLLTFGQGDEVWELFGHNAIWIKNQSLGTDIAYNWGMFDFAQPNFVTRFLTGDTSYWLEGFPLDAKLPAYRASNRSILAQELNLTPAQRLQLQRLVEENARPENKFYRYDYYKDNCSTRLRDMLDRALSGQLSRATSGIVTTDTYRSHTERLTQRNVPVYTGIMLALGHPADRPLSVWEEMFLPVRMANRLRDVKIDGPGIAIPLVRSEMTLFTAGRAPEPAKPPRLLPFYVAAGILLAGVLIALVSRAERGGRLAMFAATVVAMIWSLVAGFFGSALVAAWTLTKHFFMGWNENLLQLNPISLPLFFLIPLAIYAGRGGSKARKLSGWVAVLSLAGFLAQGVEQFSQRNGEIIGLALPLNLAVVWAVFRLTAYRRSLFAGRTATERDADAPPRI